MTPDELETYLAERFQRERQATLDLVIAIVERLLNEQLRRDGEVCELGFEKLQNLIDQMQDLVEKRARLDHAAHNEPVVDSVKMN
jgi:hypothetical protein